MSLNIPNSCIVNKFISKQTFIDKIQSGKAIFKDIEKITWSYKLSTSTLKIEKTQKVEEIQIFTVNLKSKEIPKKALQEIDKLIPYPILFLFKYADNFCYGISLKIEKKYYFSKWNEHKDFNFVDINLQKVYENLIKEFLTNIDKTDTFTKEFSQLVQEDSKIEELNKKITAIKSKINKEKQFNKQMELSKEYKKLKKELENLQ